MNLRSVTKINELFDSINKQNFNSVFFMNVIQEQMKIKRGIFKDIYGKFWPYQIHWYKKKVNRPFMHGFSYYDFAKDIVVNADEYKKVYDILADEESKKTLLTILKYKLTLDRSLLDEVAKHTVDQYFDPSVLSFGDSEVIADCGGYTGDTANIFFRLYKSARQYYLIEPDEKNLCFAKRTLAGFNNINFCNCASGETSSSVSFESKGAGGSISQNGNLAVKQISLDELVKEPLSFIKMDIEGSEIPTLNGAIKQIKKNKPRLALCAYHKPDDAWKIIKKISEIRTDYTFFLRLYVSSYCEAVIYAL